MAPGAVISIQCSKRFRPDVNELSRVGWREGLLTVAAFLVAFAALCVEVGIAIWVVRAICHLIARFA